MESERKLNNLADRAIMTKYELEQYILQICKKFPKMTH